MNRPLFKCNDCKRTFYEPHYVEEYRGEFWGTPAYETVGYCPFCDSEDFDEADIETGYWVSASDPNGNQFGTSINDANDVDELFYLFRVRYPNCEIADYGRYDEVE